MLQLGSFFIQTTLLIAKMTRMIGGITISL
jgi:hypothetical protein